MTTVHPSTLRRTATTTPDRNTSHPRNLAATAMAMTEPIPESPAPNIVVPNDANASPFKRVIDPELRQRLRDALLDLIDNHDQELTRYSEEGFLQLESAKEYIEMFARHLRDAMSTQEGVGYLLESCGYSIPPELIELNPEPRWRVQR